MKKAIKRSLSALLVFVMLISALSGLTLTASASEKIVTDPTGYTKASDVQYKTSGGYTANWGARGEDCVFLSSRATSYYTGSYTYDILSQNEGGTSQSNAPSSALYSALKSMMTAKHSHQTSYNETRDLYCYTDCLKNDTAHISSFYSGKVLNGAWDGGSTWNREHTWPNSKGLSGNDENDIMMLRPTAISENSSRGNSAYGENYYDPGVAVRGDCARIVLYVYTRWGNTSYMWGSSGVMENLDTLLRWMEEDPVDTWEMGRNDAVQSITGVRNVYVDYPEYAWLLFGRKIPSNMVTPSGEAGNSTSAFTVEAVCNNNAWGTVSVAGNTITAKPAEGYYTAGYTLVSGSATVTQDGNIFTVSPSSDCTVRINFAAKTAATVSFSGATAAPISGYAGEAITLPAPTGVPTGYTFVGWTETPLAEVTTQKPNYYAAGSAYTPTGNVTLYALFSYTEGGGAGSGDVFTLVTGAPSDWSGEYVLTSQNAAKVLLADGTAPSTSAAAVDRSSAGMTLSGNTLSGVTDKYILVVEKVGSNYSLRLKGASGNQYLAQTGSGNGDFETATSNTQTTAQWGISLSNGEAVIKNASYADRTIRYNSGSTMFRTYTSGQQAVYLYAGSSVTVYYTSDVGITPTPPAPCEHENVIEVPQTPPTCTEDGNIGYWYCEGCGKYFSDADAKNEIPKSEAILPSFDCPTEDYKDVPLSEWYHDHVDYVVKNGLMQGTDKNVFEPDTKLSRAMVATVLYRIAGSQPVTGKTGFTDVPDGEWYTDAVVWAESTGVIKGYGDGTFGPEDLITREQMMLMLARYAEIITKVDTTPTGDLKAYSDAGTVSDWAVDAVIWCVANEIVNGDGTGKLVPLNTASRAEFAKIIACFDARYNK